MKTMQKNLYLNNNVKRSRSLYVQAVLAHFI